MTWTEIFVALRRVNLPERITELIATTIPVIALLPSAYFIQRSVVKHLDASPAWATAIAVILELLGFVFAHVAIRTWNWTYFKRDKNRKENHLWIVALVLAIVHIFTLVGLAVVLDVLPYIGEFKTANLAIALMPVMAFLGAVAYAIYMLQKADEAEQYAAKHKLTVTKPHQPELPAPAAPKLSGPKNGKWDAALAAVASERPELVAGRKVTQIVRLVTEQTGTAPSKSVVSAWLDAHTRSVTTPDLPIELQAGDTRF